MKHMKGEDSVLISYLVYFVHLVLIIIGNALKKGIRAPDYVIFTLQGDYPDLRQPPGSFLQQRLRGRVKSLQELEKDFQAVAKSPQVRGVILHIGKLDLSLSQVQSLTQMINDLQASGKEVIAWATGYYTNSYLLAAAGDRILLQEGGIIYTLGFTNRALYMKDTLDWCGIEFDVVRISPYKSALDQLTRSDMSGEVREMINWLIDSHYRQFTRSIARGRSLDEVKVQTLIEQTPLSGQKAIDTGAIDGIVSAEDLPAFLGSGDKPARLANWDECRKSFPHSLPAAPGKYIAVLRVEGNIVDGKSQRPPARPPLPIPFLFNEQTGDLTFVQQARRVLRDSRAKAVLLYIDSGGGSASSSEAMASILQKIAAKKPLVALMGSVAGSGGYYVATPASYLVARPATVTGSIGVISAKIVNSRLLERLLLNRETIRRGQKDLFGSPEERFTAEEREKAGEYISQVYQLFVKRVADSRKMSADAVDQIGGGKVWTGEQALNNGLVDELGGLKAALGKLCQLANLPENTPLVETPYPKRNNAPLPTAAGWIDYTLDNLAQFREQQALLAGPLYFHLPPGPGTKLRF